jgi:hypothetical protein
MMFYSRDLIRNRVRPTRSRVVLTPRGIVPTPTGIVPTASGARPTPTGINRGISGIVRMICGIDAPRSQDGPTRSRVNLDRSRIVPIRCGIDSSMDWHRCHSKSGRCDQMRGRPHSARHRCLKLPGRCLSASGRCLSDREPPLFPRSRCLKMPGASRKMRDRFHSVTLACPKMLGSSLGLRGRIAFCGKLQHHARHGRQPNRRRYTAVYPGVARSRASQRPGWRNDFRRPPNASRLWLAVGSNRAGTKENPQPGPNAPHSPSQNLITSSEILINWAVVGSPSACCWGKIAPGSAK